MNKIMGLIGLGVAAFYFLFENDAKASIEKSVDKKRVINEPEKTTIKKVGYGVRGLDNNNPMNIVDSEIVWQGMLDPLSDGDSKFCVFKTPDYGIRAGTRILNTYFYKHNLKTINEIIARYAPEHENDTEKYIDFVADKVGIEKNDPLDFEKDINALVTAIIFYENGMNPYTINYINKGIEMA